jgi:hypothetical protein
MRTAAAEIPGKQGIPLTCLVLLETLMGGAVRIHARGCTPAPGRPLVCLVISASGSADARSTVTRITRHESLLRLPGQDDPNPNKCGRVGLGVPANAVDMRGESAYLLQRRSVKTSAERLLVDVAVSAG